MPSGPIDGYTYVLPGVVSDGPRLHACYEKLQSAEATVQALYARWAELEAMQAG